MQDYVITCCSTVDMDLDFFENNNIAFIPFTFTLNGQDYDDDYVKSFKAFKISLCFLRKMNFDQFTSRTFEIPACGGFMVAERTDDHKRLFKEDKEAVFFSSNEELLDKCKYYLAHEEERIAIAKAGRLRCETSDYSDDGVIKNAINQIIIQHGASNR